MRGMDPTAAPLLEGRRVGRVYGEGALAVRALHPSDVTVSAGEVVLVAGPSGSGKTTLLSILGLVLAPTEGEVRMRGEPVSGLTPSELARRRRRSLGFVFQQFNLLPGLPAVENVEVPLVLDSVPRAERRRRALAALEQVAIADHAGRKPRELSGGQQQRVAVARALVAEPDVLLCDEPTASLDGESGRGVMRLLRSLADGGRGVLVVTHDLRLRAVADRVVEIADGRVARLSAGGVP